MTAAVAVARLNLRAADVSRQRKYRMRDVRADSTVRELVSALTQRLGLPGKDSTGVPQVFHAFLEKTGRHLRGSEVVGEALQNDDEIVLHPDVQAGSSAARVA